MAPSRLARPFQKGRPEVTYETCALGSWNGARAQCCADGGADARQRRRRFRRTAAICNRGRDPGAAARLLPTQARILLPAPAVRGAAGRSEEHTSELQSHSELVCRLLLEKK